MKRFVTTLIDVINMYNPIQPIYVEPASIELLDEMIKKRVVLDLVLHDCEDGMHVVKGQRVYELIKVSSHHIYTNGKRFVPRRDKTDNDLNLWSILFDRKYALQLDAHENSAALCEMWWNLQYLPVNLTIIKDDNTTTEQLRDIYYKVN